MAVGSLFPKFSAMWTRNGTGLTAARCARNLYAGIYTMLQRFRSSGRRHLRPSVDLLEQRALLNAALPHLSRGLAVRAEVFAAKRASGPHRS